MEFYDEFGRKITLLEEKSELEILISVFDEETIVYSSDLNEGYLPPIQAPKRKRGKKKEKIQWLL